MRTATNPVCRNRGCGRHPQMQRARRDRDPQSPKATKPIDGAALGSVPWKNWRSVRAAQTRRWRWVRPAVLARGHRKTGPQKTGVAVDGIPWDEKPCQHPAGSTQCSPFNSEVFPEPMLNQRLRKKAGSLLPAPISKKGEAQLPLFAKGSRFGAVAKRLCTGLQIRVGRFDSGPRLQH